ncbi:MAG: MATE family efflux transporter [bacterium]|nr:MATE family efflux transporter [bacterium]
MTLKPMHGRDMTQGPLVRHLLAVAWPVSVSFLLQTFYNLVDAFWLGKLGKSALVAPTVTMNIVFIGIALAMGLGQAGTTLISQYKGANRPESMGRAAGQSFILQIGVGCLIAGLGLLFAPQLLHFLQTPADAFEGTLLYMRWILAGVPLMFIFHVYQGIYTGLGDTKGPMRINIATVILNLLLDPLFIFGWGPVPAMGVGGAAIATVIARAVASLLAIHAILGGSGFRIHPSDLRWDQKMISRLFKIGIPLSLGQAGTSLGFTLLIGIVNSFGSSVTAAFGVGHRIIMMVSVPAIALSQANATAVGQNLGAGFVDRAVKSVRNSAFLVTLILLPLTTATFFFGEHITHWFIADPEVIAYGRDLFRITSFSVFAFSLILVIFGAFSGSGHTLPVMVVNMGRLWAVRIPASWLLAVVMDKGPVGLWWAMNISNIVAGTVAFIWFMKGEWKKPVIGDQGDISELPDTDRSSPR